MKAIGASDFKFQSRASLEEGERVKSQIGRLGRCTKCSNEHREQESVGEMCAMVQTRSDEIAFHSENMYVRINKIAYVLSMLS